MADFIRIDSPLGADLLVRRLSGEESLGRLFEYRLDLLGQASEPDPDLLLGQRVTVRLERADGSLRSFNGHIARIEQTGHDGRFFTSQAVLRPWLWFLTRRTDCRIYQDLSVPDILKAVFDEYPGTSAVDFRLGAEYRKWEYCVQYRESDFNFVSRLMEHEGIYYFFEHSDAQHRLVLVDSFSTHQAAAELAQLPFHAEAPQGRPGYEYIRQWNHSREIRSGQFSTTDYDFKLPTKSLDASVLHSAPPALSQAEIYDYPGGYVDPAHGQHYADVRLGELQTGHDSASGVSNSASLRTGCIFALTHHPNDARNTNYLVTRTTIQASSAHAESGGDGSDLVCSFSVIPAHQQFRPRRSTPKPIMQGPQTAVVVGAEGEEIHVDAFGRVKVRFHWDRHEPKDNKEENRSCWIRVSQAMAGKNWGFVAIPRVRQEVIVDFLEGDPDQPIITGRIYNGEQMPPYDLPANATQSGLKSRSSKGGSPANFNEIRFEDKKGQEQVYVHAERNMDVQVENDASRHVGHDDSTTVMHDARRHVENDDSLTVKHDRTTRIENDERRHVVHNQATEVEGDRQVRVRGNHTADVAGSSVVVVGKLTDAGVDAPPGATRVDVTQGMEFRSVSEAQRVEVNGDQSIEVGGDVVYKAKNIFFEADHIEYQITGANSYLAEAKQGPYSIMANEIRLMSNTDVNIFAAGTVNQTCLKSVVTKMGPDDTSHFSIKNTLSLSMENEFSASLKMSTKASIEMSTSLGLSSSFALSAKLDTALGCSLNFGTLKQYLPPAGAGGAPGNVANTSIIATKATVVGNNAALGAIGMQYVGAMLPLTIAGMADEYEAETRAADKKKAAKQALLAAKAAMKAGHPGLAKRLLLLALGDQKELESWTPDRTDSIAQVLLSPLTEHSIDSQLEQMEAAEKAK